MAAFDYFLVFVPGYTGSVLREPSGATLWMDVARVVSFDDWIERMKYPNPLIASEVLERIAIGPFSKEMGYNGLWQALENYGMKANPRKHAPADLDVHGFAYDWRQDNRLSATQLAVKIEEWQALHPGKKVWLMAHSNGGLVARWYLNKLGGKDAVEKLILLGSPWDGTPKVMRIGINGDDFILRDWGLNPPEYRKKTAELFRTFPSLYQLIPSRNPFLRDQNNDPVDPFAQTDWLLNQQQRGYLADAKQFIADLGDEESVETICLYGRNYPNTPTAGTAEIADNGDWREVDWAYTIGGDGTIPTRSARHPKADENHEFTVEHSSFHLHEPALALLEKIFRREPTSDAKEIVFGESWVMRFFPKRDVVKVGKPVAVWADLHKRKSETELGRNITQAFQMTATVRMEWAQAMPGDDEPSTPPAPQQTQLTLKRGKLVGELPAARVPGYYHLYADISITEPGAAPSRRTVRELVAIVP